jgi:hypothetical protein
MLLIHDAAIGPEFNDPAEAQVFQALGKIAPPNRNPLGRNAHRTVLI